MKTLFQCPNTWFPTFKSAGRWNCKHLSLSGYIMDFSLDTANLTGSSKSCVPDCLSPCGSCRCQIDHVNMLVESPLSCLSTRIDLGIRNWLVTTLAWGKPKCTITCMLQNCQNWQHGMPCTQPHAHVSSSSCAPQPTSPTWCCVQHYNSNPNLCGICKNTSIFMPNFLQIFLDVGQDFQKVHGVGQWQAKNCQDLRRG